MIFFRKMHRFWVIKQKLAKIIGFLNNSKISNIHNCYFFDQIKFYPFPNIEFQKFSKLLFIHDNFHKSFSFLRKLWKPVFLTFWRCSCENFVTTFFNRISTTNTSKNPITYYVVKSLGLNLFLLSLNVSVLNILCICPHTEASMHLLFTFMILLFIFLPTYATFCNSMLYLI